MSGVVETASAPFVFDVDLYHVGSVEEQSGYHQLNEPGEMQRQHILYRENSRELSLQGELISVVHGSYDSEGEPATLCVFQFRFSGSEIGKRRFRSAMIEISFGYKNTVGTTMDPEIVMIAPDGDHVLDHAVQEVENTFSGHVRGNITPFAMGGLNIGVGWERRAPSRKEGQVTLFGIRKTVGRNYGKRNAVKWVIKENNIRAAGIPSLISVAVLLKPTDEEDFQANVTLDVEVDMVSNVTTKLRRLLGKSPVDPIYFSQKREPMGPVIPGLDVDNLKASAEVLRGLGNVKGRIPSYAPANEKQPD